MACGLGVRYTPTHYYYSQRSGILLLPRANATSKEIKNGPTTKNVKVNTFIVHHNDRLIETISRPINYKLQLNFPQPEL